MHAPVAQRIRALVFGTRGRRFESVRAYHFGVTFVKIRINIANKMMLLGGIGVMIAIITSSVTLFSTYSKTGSTCNVGSGNRCRLSAVRIVSRLAVVLLLIGLASLILGFLLRFYISIRHTKPRQDPK